MILNFATKLFGSSNDRVLKRYYTQIEPINALEPHYEAMNDEELKNQTSVLRQRLENGEPLDNLTNDAFAVVREAAKRTLGQRHYDVQLIGGLVLNDGKITEMKTGEGKTLVSTLAAYLNALSGKGVHVVTVNDYLAQRDAQWMGQVYSFLGMSTGCIMNNMDKVSRKAAYACDITYGTNNEFGFDYLRDNMEFRLEDMVQRPFNFAIVDEVDSILIDEARTPLIISGPSENATEMYFAVNKIIPKLNDDDYEIDEKSKTILLTDDGNEKVEKQLRSLDLLQEGSLYDPQNISLVHHVNQALRAHKLFSRDTDYIVKDNKVIIIDEFTGRMMEGRRFSEGLHQALEAKEGARIQNENQTLASITFQNYFRQYPKLSGMAGTALTEAAEFDEIYKLGVVAIPTNVPIARIDHDDQIYKSIDEKYEAIINLIKEAQEKQQPVLVGTVSIEKSELLSKRLKKEKIKHNVLNARYHEQEASIIAQAGRPGAVTVATNMAGRGTDIQLGGNLEMRVAEEVSEEWPEDKKTKKTEEIKAEIERDKELVKEAGGLLVVGTERHESRRIDNQLRGRSGRQGDAGASIFFLSVEDDLMRIFASDRMEMLLKSNMGLQDGEALTHPWLSKALERAQAKVEQHNFEIRKNLLKFDNVMNDQRTVIYEQRREVMDSEDISDLTTDMRHDVIEDLVSRFIPPQSYAEQWDLETLETECQRILGLELPIGQWGKEEGIADVEIQERLINASDNKIKDKINLVGKENFARVEKGFTLQILDQQWKEHLLNLDHLRQGINLRAFGQRDPLNEYKTEAFGLFEMMLFDMREKIAQVLSLVEFNMDPQDINAPQQEKPRQTQEGRSDPAMLGTGEFRDNVQQTHDQSQTIAFDQNDPRSWGKVGRNALCPCGSGKKFKHCHGALV